MPSTILIVDDDPANRQTIEIILSQDNYQLILCENGDEALHHAQTSTIDVVLLDIMMPGMDGYEVCRRLRADIKTSEIPVVMLTALNDQQSRLLGMEAGADDFISKPVDMYELRARVGSITRLNRYRNLMTERARLAQALRELENAYDATIETWSRALSYRDTGTEEHSQRVTELTIKIALTCGWPEDYVVQLRRGALLHDIGKMGLADSILKNAEHLSPEEAELMRKHPTYALKMLEPITYLASAVDIPYCHHECWDGSGYPRGLRGEQIPLSARIFAIADAWEELTSHLPIELAAQSLREQSGKRFDPRIVETFLRQALDRRQEPL